MAGEIDAVLDHVVVNAQDSLEEAAMRYRRLGFALTEPSRHSLGSINRTAVFARDYLELVAIDRDAPAPRMELMRSPPGLEGLVFATADADRLCRTLRERGVPASEPVDFSRPVRLAGGDAEARFRVVRLTQGIPFGRCYFCQHLTPDLVWRADWCAHRNGAEAIRRVMLAARQPAALESLFERLFGARAARRRGAVFELAMGTARLEIVAGEGDAIVGLDVAVRSLGEAARVLAAAGIGARIESGRILVPPEAAWGAALAFVQD